MDTRYITIALKPPSIADGEPAIGIFLAFGLALGLGSPYCDGRVSVVASIAPVETGYTVDLVVISV